MIVFIPFFMINNRVTGSAYFAKLDPYLIYVEIFAIIYGQQQAAFSSFLAVAGYIFRQTYSRSGFDVMLDYNTYVWMAQLVILGLSVGYLRDKIRTIKDDRKDSLTGKYVEIKLYSSRDNEVGKRYIQIQTTDVNQTQDFNFYFEKNDVAEPG